MVPSPQDVLAPGKLPSELLAKLLDTYARVDDPTVIVPAAPGHDAAVFRSPGDIIVKSDPITFSTAAPARYLVAVNANDIACLGGIPRWVTVTALFPEGTTAQDVEDLFTELSRACEANGITLIGGHSEITPGIDRLLLSATVLGVPGPSGILRPGGASAGDDVYLTRTAGIEGTSILATELPTAVLAGIPDVTIEAAKDLINDPGISVVVAAQVALATGAVHAMHDPTEGGVATAVHEVSDAAGLGATVNLDNIPVSPATRAICDLAGISPYGLLSSGALLFTAPQSARATIDTAFADVGIEIARIGEIEPDPTIRIAMQLGTSSPLPRYDADEITRAFARFATLENGGQGA